MMTSSATTKKKLLRPTAQRLASSLSHGPLDGIIVGEPTDNTIVEAHKETYRYRIDLQGKSAHSAYPEQGVHAIHAGADLIRNLESRMREKARAANLAKRSTPFNRSNLKVAADLISKALIERPDCASRSTSLPLLSRKKYRLESCGWPLPKRC